jgi:hypothetical protein
MKFNALVFSAMAILFGSTATLANTCQQEFALLCPAGQIDACLIPNSNATHHFCTSQTSANYQFLNRIQIAEASQAQFLLLNGTPAIKQFMVVMEEKCAISKAAVVKANPRDFIEATRLLGSKRVGSYSIGYEYAVNGGYGANLASIVVTMARHGGPFIIDVCPVDVYVAF